MKRQVLLSIVLVAVVAGVAGVSLYHPTTPTTNSVVYTEKVQMDSYSFGASGFAVSMSGSAVSATGQSSSVVIRNWKLGTCGDLNASRDGNVTLPGSIQIYSSDCSAYWGMAWTKGNYEWSVKTERGNVFSFNVTYN